MIKTGWMKFIKGAFGINRCTINISLTVKYVYSIVRVMVGITYYKFYRAVQIKICKQCNFDVYEMGFAINPFYCPLWPTRFHWDRVFWYHHHHHHRRS